MARAAGSRRWSRGRSLGVGLVVLALGAMAVERADAQELSPRAYWPAPRGTQGVIIGWAHSDGDVATDPSLPVFGVDSNIHSGLTAYFRTIRLWGRSSNLIFELPYVAGVTDGELDGEPASSRYSGLGDVSVTWSINLVGAPSMTRAEFQEFRKAPRSIFGASLKVTAPTGKYDEDRVINISTNRWSTKAEIGAVIPLRPSWKWLLELEAGATLFGDNDDFVGTRREQEPIYSTEFHLVRRFKPGLWAAFDANFYYGGRSTIDGDERADLQRSSRFGATVVVPFSGRFAVKLGYSTGVVTESGSDYDSVLVSLTTVLPRRGE